MGRRPGSRNADYARARDEILDRLHRVGLSGRFGLSFRELAQAAAVTPSTLRHYFGDREGVIAALLERIHEEGLVHLAAAATEVRGDVLESLTWFVGYTRLGWSRGVGAAHALGLAEGLARRPLGHAYLNHLLEPTLQAAEARIARHVAQGELGPCDVRHAALELLAPVLLALVHQEPLGGAEIRALDLDAFVRDHVERFVRAHAPDAAARSAPAKGRPSRA